RTLGAAARRGIPGVRWGDGVGGRGRAGVRPRRGGITGCSARGGGGGSGRGWGGDRASAELRFVYYVQSQGGLNPPLRVIGNQVIVNYQ
ncbi:flagellar protein FlhE, partial [Serratia marcescens]|nr:flagellar protein FlhE [Serratia marcescens]